MTTLAESMRTAVIGRLGVRTVRCYHCDHECQVPAQGMTVTCSHCYKQISLEDISVRAMHWGGSLRTTGVIVIHRKARAVSQEVVASLGVRVLGTLEANIRSGGPVFIGAAATFKGAINAPRLIVEPGAQLLGGPFRVPGCFVEGASKPESNQPSA